MRKIQNLRIRKNLRADAVLSNREMLSYLKEHLSMLVEQSKDFGIITFDYNRNTVTWNPGAQAIFGFRKEEVIGRDAEFIFTPEDRKNRIPDMEFETAIQTGRSEDERWHLRKDGGRLFASGVLTAMYDERGRIIGFTKIVRDITPLKHAQEKLVEERNRADAASAAKTEFLNSISHEIRTPMSAIKGLAYILARTQPLSDKQKEYINTIEISAESLISLINNLLDVSKIEARTVELENIPFSLLQILDEIIKMMEVKAKEKNLTLILEAECIEGCNFLGDPTRIRQIIINLCSNAIKFTENGSIDIRVSTQQTDRDNIHDVCVAIRDTGIGIPEEKLSTVFNRFSQADSSISRKYGGTGLGLTIAKELTELMGGTITAYSEFGKGSTFTVCLPLKISHNNDND
jgi:PAS domain S-box-containing protein